MIVKEVIAPIELSTSGTHNFMDMVQFKENIFSFVLLPVIIFCSSFNMDHHASIFFNLYIKQITFFAVLGTILAITFTGVSIFAINNYLVEGGMLAYDMNIAVSTIPFNPVVPHNFISSLFGALSRTHRGSAQLQLFRRL